MIMATTAPLCQIVLIVLLIVLIVLLIMRTFMYNKCFFVDCVCFRYQIVEVY
jgi:hypothetical protein